MTVNVNYSLYRYMIENTVHSQLSGGRRERFLEDVFTCI